MNPKITFDEIQKVIQISENKLFKGKTIKK